jgi:predicted nucleic acid-binding protein
MAINPSDPSQFHKLNVVDSCSIDNILSSQLFYTTAQLVGCNFCCTMFVYYECLTKPRKNPTPEAMELQSIFRQETENGKIKNFNLDIEDLQEVSVLENRKKLGKGELASIVFAKKTNQAFLTDDRGARNLASEVMNPRLVQTTTHLLGWLFFENFLGDSDLQPIINEHEKKYNRKLGKYFKEMYHRALEYRSKKFIIINDNEANL